MGISFGGYPVYDPLQLLHECKRQGESTEAWLGLVNTAVCPLGTEPGGGRLLMLLNDLNRMKKDSYQDLIFNDSVHKPLTFKKMVVTGMECPLPGADGDVANIYVVSFKDRRFILNRLETLKRSYNVRSPDSYEYVDETLKDDGDAWTWEEMVQDIWETALPDEEYPELPFTPNGTPENFCFFDKPAMAALGHVLTRLACALKLDWVKDEFSIVQLGDSSNVEADSIIRAVGQTIFDAYPLETDTIRYPEKVRVQFYGLPKTLLDTVKCLAVDKDVSVEPADINIGTFVDLYDDLVAQIEPDGSIGNQADLEARATERAADWERKRTYSDAPFLRAYSGVRDFTRVLGSNYGMVAWEDKGRGLKTSIRSYPDEALENWRRNCDCCPCSGEGTTTTTLPPCTGECLWGWDNVGKVWDKASDTCAVGCSCQPPGGCGSINCQTHTTGCYNTITVGSTTTVDCGTTTTPPVQQTTPPCLPTDCDGGCLWCCDGTNWIPTGSTCSTTCISDPGSCYCVDEPLLDDCTAANMCECRSARCGTTTTTDVCPGCTPCTWECVPFDGVTAAFWNNTNSAILTGSNCTDGTHNINGPDGNPAKCCCPYPNAPCCYSWQTAQTCCRHTSAGCGTPTHNCHVTTTSSTSSTTTTHDAGCTGNCTMQCAPNGLGWSIFGSNCVGAGCGCPTPATPCAPGQVQLVACQTSATTTTPSPCSSEVCHWTCHGMFGVGWLTSDVCSDGGCSCSPPAIICGPGNDGATANTNCTL